MTKRRIFGGKKTLYGLLLEADSFSTCVLIQLKPNKKYKYLYKTHLKLKLLIYYSISQTETLVWSKYFMQINALTVSTTEYFSLKFGSVRCVVFLTLAQIMHSIVSILVFCVKSIKLNLRKKTKTKQNRGA